MPNNQGMTPVAAGLSPNAGYEPTSDRSLKNVLASNKRVLQRCRVLTGSARHIA